MMMVLLCVVVVGLLLRVVFGVRGVVMPLMHRMLQESLVGYCIVSVFVVFRVPRMLLNGSLLHWLVTALVGYCVVSGASDASIGGISALVGY